MSRELDWLRTELRQRISYFCEDENDEQLIWDCINDPDVMAAIDAFLTQMHIEEEA